MDFQWYGVEYQHPRMLTRVIRSLLGIHRRPHEKIISNPSCAVGTQVKYDILFHGLKGDEHLKFYVGIFFRPTLKLLLSCQDWWIPCWNWYAIWPSLLICDWEHAFDFSAVTWAPWCQRTLLFFNSLLRLAKTVRVRITGNAPVTGGLQQATNSAKLCLCHIVIMICMWTFRG